MNNEVLIMHNFAQYLNNEANHQINLVLADGSPFKL